MSKGFLALGSAAAGLAVALGAFGAHALKSGLGAEALAVYQTGVHYQSIHALGLVLIGVLLRQHPGARLIEAAGWLLAAGILLFSGSLYALALGGPRALAWLTPLGGSAFLLGWLCLALAALRQRDA